jgi:ABC-type polysaccharide/polyol phosphate transport system ATPase subunit
MNNNFSIDLKNVSLDISKISFENRFFTNKKIYTKKKLILDDVSIKINEGENLGIIGPNGAGKSTLLRIIAEIYRPTSGKIEVRGSCLPLIGAILSDEYLTGYETILNSLLLFGITYNEAKKKIDEIIDFIDIDEYIYKAQYTYSDGMKARVAFSTILYSRPSILTIDENIGAGDRFFLEKAKKKIDQILSSIPILVISSHDESLISQFTKKSIILSKGKIVMNGDTEEVLNYYKSKDFEKNHLS